jgi:predicted dinucleotide-binding enzyme
MEIVVLAVPLLIIQAAAAAVAQAVQGALVVQVLLLYQYQLQNGLVHIPELILCLQQLAQIQ